MGESMAPARQRQRPVRKERTEGRVMTLGESVGPDPTWPQAIPTCLQPAYEKQAHYALYVTAMVFTLSSHPKNPPTSMPLPFPPANLKPPGQPPEGDEPLCRLSQRAHANAHSLCFNKILRSQIPLLLLTTETLEQQGTKSLMCLEDILQCESGSQIMTCVEWESGLRGVCTGASGSCEYMIRALTVHHESCFSALQLSFQSLILGNCLSLSS